AGPGRRSPSAVGPRARPAGSPARPGTGRFPRSASRAAPSPGAAWTCRRRWGRSPPGPRLPPPPALARRARAAPPGRPGCRGARRPAAPSGRGQHVDGAPVQRELPVTITLDLEDLVHEPGHLELQVVVALRGRAGLVEADEEGPGRAE